MVFVSYYYNETSRRTLIGRPFERVTLSAAKGLIPASKETLHFVQNDMSRCSAMAMTYTCIPSIS
jgi:hypothetical protein